MEQVISATEARVHFGELMRRVVETNIPVTVERDGKPQVVILSKPAYDQMCTGQNKPDWRELLRRAHEHIRAEAPGRPPFPPPEEIIRQMREDRDAELGLP